MAGFAEPPSKAGVTQLLKAWSEGTKWPWES